MATTDTTKKENPNPATIEEALENAGTTVLSRLEGRAHMLTRDEVKQYLEENHLTGEPLEGEHRAYAGPFTDPNDLRNFWTAEQDMGGKDMKSETQQKKTPNQQPAPQKPNERQHDRQHERQS